MSGGIEIARTGGATGIEKLTSKPKRKAH
jgi:hypothetical protein